MITQEEKDDERLLPILREISKAGTPYGEEPDPRYWSNFRVRVMERVEAAEIRRQPLASRLWQWITERPLRAGAVGFSMAALVLAGVLTNPFATSQKDVAIVQPARQMHHDTVVTTPAAKPLALPEHVITKPSIDVADQQQIASTNRAVTKMLHSKEYAAHLQHAADASKPSMAEADQSVSTVTASASDLPVSLNELTESQLESVLHSLEQNK